MVRSTKNSKAAKASAIPKAKLAAAPKKSARSRKPTEKAEKRVSTNTTLISIKQHAGLDDNVFPTDPISPDESALQHPHLLQWYLQRSSQVNLSICVARVSNPLAI